MCRSCAATPFREHKRQERRERREEVEQRMLLRITSIDLRYELEQVVCVTIVVVNKQRSQ